MCCSVAVLQFQNKLYESQKSTLYLYINIEVFLGYGNSLERTATLQQLQQTLSNYSGKISQKNEKFLAKYSRTAMKDYYLCSVKQ